MLRFFSLAVLFSVSLIFMFAPKVTASLNCPVNNSCCFQPIQQCKANGKDLSCPQDYQWCYAGYCVSEKYDPLTNSCPQLVPSPFPSPSLSPVPSGSCPVSNSCCTQILQKCKQNGKDDSCPIGFQWCYSGFCVNEDYNPTTNSCPITQPNPNISPSPSIIPTPKPTPTPVPTFNQPSSCPVTGRITVPYGYNIIGYAGNNAGCAGLARCHNGIDIAALTGTAISATMNGVVSESRWDLYKGNYISITNPITGITTVFEHLNLLSPFKTGNSVVKGQTIGYIGRTGMGVTGPHLHYKLQKGIILLNPFRFLKITNPDPLLTMTSDALINNNYHNLLPLGIGHNISNWGMCVK